MVEGVEGRQKERKRATATMEKRLFCVVMKKYDVTSRYCTSERVEKRANKNPTKTDQKIYMVCPYGGLINEKVTGTFRIVRNLKLINEIVIDKIL